MQVIITILLILILGILTVVGYFLKDAPKLFRVLKVENLRARNEKDIQREAYFRQISGSELEKVFKDWTSFLTEMDSLPQKMAGDSGKKFYNDLITKTIMYGSETTVFTVSRLSQKLYVNNRIEKQVEIDMNKDEDNGENFEVVYYIAKIISCLKYDFTGYNVDPIDLIATKLNEFDKKEIKKQVYAARDIVNAELNER